MKALAVLAFLASSLPAQTCVYNWTSNPAGGNGGFSDIFEFASSPPFNSLWQRHHLLVPEVVFQNNPARITEVSIGVGAGSRTLRFDEFTLRMSQTSVTSLNDNFASNINASLQTVLTVREHVWHQGFGPDWVPFGLQQPFQFVPGHGNVLIEIVTRNKALAANYSFTSGGSSPLGDWIIGGGSTLPVTATSGLQPPILRFCVDRAEITLSGQPCQGSANSTPLLGALGRPTPGSTPTISLSDVAPGSIAACAFGFDTTAAPFPLDLTPLGAPGCRQYFAPAFADVVVANAFGFAQKQILVPATINVVGAIVYAQYFVLDPPANALDVTSSNYARLLVGL